MPGLLYVPAGEGGEPHMEGAVFPRRRRKRINEERGEEQMFAKMLPHDKGDNEMMSAHKTGMKGKNGGMHKMPDGMMMRDDEMKAMMNGKKKKPAMLHPRDAMKKMSKKMSSLDY